MLRFRRLSCLCFLALFGLSISRAGERQTRNSQAALEQILARMEAVGKTFQSFSADYVMRSYNAILKEFAETEKGHLLYKRARDGSAMLRQQVTSPAGRILTIKGGILLLFRPSLKEATQYTLGANKDKAEYLALGIGQSPAKLRETFDISEAGEEAVGGGACSVLQLKPKTENIKSTFSVITLWVNKATGVPVQQKLQEPYGNYALYTFTNEVLNSKIPDSEFEQKLPKGVTIQRIK